MCTCIYKPKNILKIQYMLYTNTVLFDENIQSTYNALVIEIFIRAQAVIQLLIDYLDGIVTMRGTATIAVTGPQDKLVRE